MNRDRESTQDDTRKLAKRLAKPQTIEQLTKHFGRDRATVYRWMTKLRQEGVLIERVGMTRPTQYRIPPEG